jgi:hypothetical protein
MKQIVTQNKIKHLVKNLLTKNWFHKKELIY